MKSECTIPKKATHWRSSLSGEIKKLVNNLRKSQYQFLIYSGVLITLVLMKVASIIEITRDRQSTILVDELLIPALIGLVILIGITYGLISYRRIYQMLVRAEDKAQIASLVLRDVIREWNLATGEVQWDNKVQQLFGYSPYEIDNSIE